MISDDLERWANMGILGLDTQVYDLSAATEFVMEIADANEKASAPLFLSGLPPAKSFVVLTKNSEHDQWCFMVKRVSDTHVQCDLMQTLEVEVMRKRADHHRERTRSLKNEVSQMLKCSPDNVLDMLGIKNLSELGDIPKEYITGEGIDPQEDEKIALIEIGSPIKEDGTWVPPVLHICSAACEFMAMPIATSTPAQLPRATRRRLERTGRGVSLVTVGIARSVSEGYARKKPAVHGRALHFVSGHWRLSEASAHRRWVFGGWRIWIEGHWRGDPAYGVLLHRYVAKAHLTPSRPEPVRELVD